LIAHSKIDRSIFGALGYADNTGGPASRVARPFSTRGFQVFALLESELNGQDRPWCLPSLQ
jgi:hypothetical protein